MLNKSFSLLVHLSFTLAYGLFFDLCNVFTLGAQVQVSGYRRKMLRVLTS